MNVQSNGHYGLRLFIMFIFYLKMQNVLPKQEKKNNNNRITKQHIDNYRVNPKHQSISRP